MLEQAESVLSQNSAELFTMRMYVDGVRMQVYHRNGQLEAALLIANQLVRELSMIDSMYYSLSVVVVMDRILFVHLAQKCTKAIEQDFYLLDKISEFYPLGHIIKKKHMDSMINTPFDENIENRVIEEIEISKGPLFPHDEPTDTLNLIPKEINLETLTGNETNLPWYEAI